MKSRNQSALVLVSCDQDRKDVWCTKYPTKGIIEGELDGWLWGEGDGWRGFYLKDSVWLVIKVNSNGINQHDGYVTFKKGTILYCGNQAQATNYLLSNGAQGKAVVGSLVIVEEDYQPAITGDSGTAIAGNYGLAVAGTAGTAIARTFGTAIAGYKRTYRSHYIGGYAKVGNFGTAITGYAGKVSAGIGGCVQIKYNDPSPKMAVGYIGKNGLLADVVYELNNRHEFVPTINSIIELGIKYFINKNDGDEICLFLNEHFSNYPAIFQKNYEKLVRGLSKKSKRLVDAFLVTIVLSK